MEEVRDLLREGGGISTVGDRKRGFLLKPIPSPEEGRGSETHYQSKGIKLVHSTRTLQDGRNPYLEGHSKTQGLDGQNRSKGCLLHNPNTHHTEKVPQVCGVRTNISVQLSHVRSVISAMGLYQDPQISGSTAAGDGSTNDCVHRRHPHTSFTETCK